MEGRSTQIANYGTTSSESELRHRKGGVFSTATAAEIAAPIPLQSADEDFIKHQEKNRFEAAQFADAAAFEAAATDENIPMPANVELPPDVEAAETRAAEQISSVATALKETVVGAATTAVHLAADAGHTIKEAFVEAAHEEDSAGRSIASVSENVKQKMVHAAEAAIHMAADVGHSIEHYIEDAIPTTSHNPGEEIPLLPREAGYERIPDSPIDETLPRNLPEGHSAAGDRFVHVVEAVKDLVVEASMAAVHLAEDAGHAIKEAFTEPLPAPATELSPMDRDLPWIDPSLPEIQQGLPRATIVSHEEAKTGTSIGTQLASATHAAKEAVVGAVATGMYAVADAGHTVKDAILPFNTASLSSNSTTPIQTTATRDAAIAQYPEPVAESNLQHASHVAKETALLAKGKVVEAAKAVAHVAEDAGHALVEVCGEFNPHHTILHSDGSAPLDTNLPIHERELATTSQPATEKIAHMASAAKDTVVSAAQSAVQMTKDVGQSIKDTMEGAAIADLPHGHVAPAPIGASPAPVLNTDISVPAAAKPIVHQTTLHEPEVLIAHHKHATSEMDKENVPLPRSKQQQQGSSHQSHKQDFGAKGKLRKGASPSREQSGLSPERHHEPQLSSSLKSNSSSTEGKPAWH